MFIKKVFLSTKSYGCRAEPGLWRLAPAQPTFPHATLPPAQIEVPASELVHPNPEVSCQRDRTHPGIAAT